jgi:ubiquinone/menaquinone biosynthesis C-methylase UbiE
MCPGARLEDAFYAGDGVAIWHGDARRLPIDDASIDLILTSWPYNDGVAYDGYSDRLTWSKYWDDLIAPFLSEAFRVLRYGGRLVLNTQNVMEFADRD